MSLREQFEAAVIARMKESGFLEVEIRVECLSRSGDGYYDGSIDAYWHFWKESRAALVVELPQIVAYEAGYDSIRENEYAAQSSELFDADEVFALNRSIEVREAIEAAGLKVMP